jgi:hypothetical protein
MEFKQWMEGREQNAAAVAAAFQKGIDPNDPEVLGYHGTSLQAIQHLIQTGSLTVTKGTASVFGSDHYKGRTYGIHLVPNPRNPKVMAMEFRSPLHRGFKTPMDDATGWATHIADRHHIMKTHGLDLSKITHHRAADDIQSLVDPDKATRGIRRGKPDAAAIRGGVVLAISQRVMERFRIGVGGDGNDINIESTELPVEFITGIEPENDAAYGWLDGLSQGPS